MVVQTSSTAQRLIGQGDRFFTYVRWFILLLLFVLDFQLNNRSIIPPTISTFALVWWAYAAFTLLFTVAHFFPRLLPDVLMAWTFVADLGFITLLSIVGAIIPTTVYPFFILPIIWAALRRTPFQSMIAGLVAAGLYLTAAYFYYRNVLEIDLDEQILVSFVLGALTLIFIAWITSALSERQGVTNREQVVVAQRNVQQARQDAEAYRDRMRSLYEVALSLTTSMKFQQVLDRTVQESVRIVNAQTSLVLLPTGKPDELYIAAGEGLGPGDLNRRVDVNPTGILGTVFAAGTPRIVDQIEISPAMQSVTALQACSNACCVPLTAGRRNYGILIVAAQQPFNPDALEMVTSLANYAIIAMLNAQLSTEVQEERAKLISKEEQVRQQLARDLHDGPAQSVAAITMNIEFVRRLLERDPQRVLDELIKLGELARRTTYDIRTLLFELRPLSLDSQGLISTLKEYAERFKDSPTKVIVEEQVGDLQLDTKRESTIFNIIQESTNNALKHAQAKHIWIRLQRQGDELMATIQDDGRGFDLQGVKENYNQRGSFGLLNIEERARMVGGFAEMNSAPGAGTTVRVIVPLEADSI